MSRPASTWVGQISTTYPCNSDQPRFLVPTPDGDTTIHWVGIRVSAPRSTPTSRHPPNRTNPGEVTPGPALLIHPLKLSRCQIPALVTSWSSPPNEHPACDPRAVSKPMCLVRLVVHRNDLGPVRRKVRPKAATFSVPR